MVRRVAYSEGNIDARDDVGSLDASRVGDSAAVDVGAAGPNDLSDSLASDDGKGHKSGCGELHAIKYELVSLSVTIGELVWHSLGSVY